MRPRPLESVSIFDIFFKSVIDIARYDVDYVPDSTLFGSFGSSVEQEITSPKAAPEVVPL